MRNLILLLAVFGLSACESDSGGGGGTPVDYPARFGEDTEGGATIPGDASDTSAGQLILSNGPLRDWLGALTSGVPLTEVFGKQEEPRLGLRQKGFGVPYQPDPGTYDYDVENPEGPWILVDPEQPVDSALFVFGVEDGLTADVDEQQDVPISVQVQYRVELITFEDLEIEWNTTTEVSYEPALPSKAFEMIFRQHLNFHVVYDEFGYDMSYDVGDAAAAAPVASGEASWLGPLVIHFTLFENGSETPSSNTSSYGHTRQIYDSETDFVLAEGDKLTTIENFPAKGGSLVEYGDVFLHFGFTSTPANPPWQLDATIDLVAEPPTLEGVARYRGREVATIVGDDTTIACESCDPPKECENIWLTWNDDPENPVLLCELLGILD